ncbi:plasmid mobilization protein [Dyadobacter frigoris]|uniref:Plasmid mobilization relaxosome protein MobC n=1 Tax=Dyadobacter frigoris TaxID=2576211 RepID=A0A4U6CLI2_9BACT|nr:plasmid mobilization relaxosome protein MobC [Dyadobacter frigoris]TKT84886.1 plasmid mobilization relaxosome protein MobC [Dyadobacter frigoris]
MKEENNNRNKWLHVRLTDKEYEQIQEQFRQTTDLKLSDFVRKKLLGKLIIGSYRDASMDAFMEELIGLKNGLSAIGNNFNQAVKRLHTLSRIKEFEHWLVSYELDRRKLFKQVGQAQDFIKKMADKWLQ